MNGIGRARKINNFSSAIWTASFSSGAGRGRGGPFPPPRTSNAIGKQPEDNTEDEFSKPPLPAGRGRGVSHGRGREVFPKDEIAQQTPFQSWGPELSVGAGRGRGIVKRPMDSKTEPRVGIKPIFMRRPVEPSKPQEPYGRGRFEQQQERQTPSEENRYFRPMRLAIPGEGQFPGATRLAGQPRARGDGQFSGATRPTEQPRAPGPAAPRLAGEDAVKQALGILAKRAEETGDYAAPPGRGGGGRGRRGGGRGGGRGGRWRNEDSDEDEDEDEDDEDEDEDWDMGDDEAGERFVKRIGEDKWREIEEVIDNAAAEFLPDPTDDALEEALHTNFMLEFEPEYYMEDFGTNPDIDEKPPMPLRDYLEKIKPLLVHAEEIQNEEEWKEFLEDTMDRVPYLRELLHRYSGFGRLTAQKEQEHLKAVASHLPDNAHQSVKNLTDRALLSLQSNPGWDFDKKYIFMKTLVGDVSKYYEQKRSR